MPLSTSTALNLNFSIFTSQSVQILFYLLLIAFTIHSVFLAYHWFTYGNSKHISMIALATYLSGGAILLLTFSLAIQAL